MGARLNTLNTSDEPAVPDRQKKSLEQIEAMADLIIATLEEKQAERIEKIKVSDKTSLADFFVICSGRNNTHIKVLADATEEAVEQKLGVRVMSVEGLDAKRWVLLDYGDIVVHILGRDERDFYNLDRLWEQRPTQSEPAN